MAVLRNGQVSATNTAASRLPDSLAFNARFETEYVRGEMERLKKKLQRLNKRLDEPDNQVERDYFSSLLLALDATFRCPDYYEAWDTAHAVTKQWGMTEWFLRALAPKIKERFGRL